MCGAVSNTLMGMEIKAFDSGVDAKIETEIVTRRTETLTLLNSSLSLTIINGYQSDVCGAIKHFTATKWEVFSTGFNVWM